MSVFFAGLALMFIYWLFSVIGVYALFLIIGVIWALVMYADYIPPRKLSKAEKLDKRQKDQAAWITEKEKRNEFLQMERIRISNLPPLLKQWKYMWTFFPGLSAWICLIIAMAALWVIPLIVESRS